MHTFRVHKETELSTLSRKARRTSPPTPLRWRGEKKEDEHSPLHRRGVGGEVLRHNLYNSVKKQKSNL
jgi:hypothetical protein